MLACIVALLGVMSRDVQLQRCRVSDRLRAVLTANAHARFVHDDLMILQRCFVLKPRRAVGTEERSFIGMLCLMHEHVVAGREDFVTRRTRVHRVVARLVVRCQTVEFAERHVTVVALKHAVFAAHLMALSHVHLQPSVVDERILTHHAVNARRLLVAPMSSNQMPAQCVVVLDFVAADVAHNRCAVRLRFVMRKDIEMLRLVVPL